MLSCGLRWPSRTDLSACLTTETNFCFFIYCETLSPSASLDLEVAASATSRGPRLKSDLSPTISHAKVCFAIHNVVLEHAESDNSNNCDSSFAIVLIALAIKHEGTNETCKNLICTLIGQQVAEKVKEFFHNEGIHSTTIQPGECSQEGVGRASLASPTHREVASKKASWR